MMNEAVEMRMKEIERFARYYKEQKVSYETLQKVLARNERQIYKLVNK